MVNLICIDICFLFICADILNCQCKFCDIFIFYDAVYNGKYLQNLFPVPEILHFKQKKVQENV